MEYWSFGVLVINGMLSNFMFPVLQYSINPFIKPQSVFPNPNSRSLRMQPPRQFLFTIRFRVQNIVFLEGL